MGDRGFLLFPVLCAAISFNLNAETDEFGALSKHVHGLAELTIVNEGNTLELELVSPAANLWGFERAPKNPQETKTIKDAIAKLEKPSQFLSIKNSQCRVANVTHSVDTSMIDGNESNSTSHKDHEEHEGHASHKDHEEHEGHASHIDHEEHEGHASHKGHKDHEEHEGHASHKDHDSHTDNSHPDVTVSYRYICSEGGSVDVLTFNIFEQFPSIHSVEVMFIKQGRQGAVTLDNSNYTIQF